MVSLAHAGTVRSIREELRRATDDVLERVAVLQLVMEQELSAAGAGTSKIAQGTRGEQIACVHLGFRWGTAGIHGTDAVDDEGHGVELKASVLKSSTRGAKLNFIYRLPQIKRDETVEFYVGKVYDKYVRECPGGHYWVAYTAKTHSVEWCWWLPAVKMAQLLAHKARLTLEKNGCDKPIVLNFGRPPCKRCNCVHYIDQLVRVFDSDDKKGNNRWSATRLPTHRARRNAETIEQHAIKVVCERTVKCPAV